MNVIRCFQFRESCPCIEWHKEHEHFLKHAHLDLPLVTLVREVKTGDTPISSCFSDASGEN